MNKLKCVLLACCILSIIVHGGFCEEESQHSYKEDMSCVDCADISDSYKRECICRTYTFAFNGAFGLEHWNEETNQPEGPTVEIVKKVCEYANRDCDMVLVPRSNCWNGQYSPALNERWYDVCIAYNQDPLRRLYAFPKYGYLTFGNFHVLARPGSNITEEMIRNTSNDFTLAYVTGEKLLSRDILDLFYNAGFFIKPQNLIVINAEPATAGDSVNMLLDKINEPECDKKNDDDDESQQIDLTLHLGITLDKKLPGEDFTFVAEFAGRQYTHSLMFRRDDRCLMSWWDEAYEAFICSDGYLDFCQGLNEEGGNRWDICQNRSMCA